MDMIKKSRVFVCQEPLRRSKGRVVSRDISSAEQYGELITVVRWSDTERVDPTADRLLWKVRECLTKNHFSDRDYVLLIGDPTVIQLVGMIAAEMSGGRYRTLQWDNKNHRYDVISVDLHCQPQ